MITFDELKVRQEKRQQTREFERCRYRENTHESREKILGEIEKLVLEASDNGGDSVNYVVEADKIKWPDIFIDCVRKWLGDLGYDTSLPHGYLRFNRNGQWTHVIRIMITDPPKDTQFI